MGKSILITGSMGSYGAALVKIGREWGYDIYHTDIREPEVADKSFIQADISNKESIKPLADLELDAVIHCAGIIDVRASELHQKVHVIGTENLIDLLGDKVKVWITVSSAAIHGGTEEDVPMDETFPRTVEESYTRTKEIQWDMTFKRLPKKGIVIEPALIYDERNRYMFKEMVEMAAMDLMLTLVERGSLKMGMVHPLDIAAATLLLVERGEFGESYMICDDNPVTVRDLANLTAQVTECKPYDPKRSITKSTLQRILKQVGRLRENMPSLEGMEPLGSMMEEMGLNLEGFQLPISTSWLMEHHYYSNRKVKEVTKRNATQWRLLEKSTKFYPNGWYPEINPFFEIPKVIKNWVAEGKIKKKYELRDLLEYFYDTFSGMF